MKANDFDLSAAELPAPITKAIDRNYRYFDWLQNLVEVLGRDVSADEVTMAVAQAAADFGWYNQTGAYSAARIENALEQIGLRLNEPWTWRSDSEPSNPQRVLHVFSEAHHSAGGHVRMPWRWIQHDPARQHSVVVTNQPGHEGPSPVLAGLAVSTGGTVEVLNDQFPELLARARRLRQLASQADIVVLHIHPYDVVASVALAGRKAGPSTIFVNHADHVFWLGTGIADLVANCRQAGSDISVYRRGVAPERSQILPLVLDEVKRTRTQGEAKALLGYDPSTIVLVTAATWYKYETVGGMDFLDLVTPVLDSLPNVVLLAAGGGDRSAWVDAVNRTNGKIVLMERQSDMSVLREAADVFLDSYPFNSVTSFLEAAAYGTPILNFGPYGPEMATVHSDDYVNNEIILQARTIDEYHEMLAQLIVNPAERQRLGAAALAGLEKESISPGWDAYLEKIYAVLPTLSPAHAPYQDPPLTTSRVDAFNYILHTRTQFARSVDDILRSYGIDPASLPGRPL